MVVKRIKEKIRKHFQEVIELKTSPYKIALGFAIGTAIAILPTLGLGIFIGIFLVLIFKKLNKLSLFVAFAFWNPILLIFTTALSYGIGDWLFSDLPVLNLKFELLNQVFILTRRFLIGNLIVTIFFTFLSYSIVFYLVKSYYKRNSIVYKTVKASEELVEKVENS